MNSLFSEVMRLFKENEEGRLCVIVTLDLLLGLSEEKALQLDWAGHDAIASITRNLIDKDEAQFINVLNLCIDTLNPVFRERFLIEE